MALRKDRLQLLDLGPTLTAPPRRADAEQLGSGPTLPVPSGPAAPVNTALPVITGTAQQGQTLTTSTGTWTGSPTSYSYAWSRSGTPIGGATASTYLLVSADVGHTITSTVTAHNDGGSTPATSAPTGTVVTWAPVVPGAYLRYVSGLQEGTDGDPLDTIVDSVGSADAVATITGAVYVAGGGPNGRAALEFTDNPYSVSPLSIDTQNFTIYAVVRVKTVGTQRLLLTQAQSGNLVGFYNRVIAMLLVGEQTIDELHSPIHSVGGRYGWGVYVWRSNATAPETIDVANGYTYTGTLASPAAVSSGWVLGAASTAGGAGLIGSFADLAVCPAHDDAAVAATVAALQTGYGLPIGYSAPNRLVCAGNSIPYGAGSYPDTDADYPAQAGALLGADWDVIDPSIAANTWANMITSQTTRVDDLYGAIDLNLLLGQEWTNSLQQVSAAQAIDDMIAWYAERAETWENRLITDCPPSIITANDWQAKCATVNAALAVDFPSATAVPYVYAAGVGVTYAQYCLRWSELGLDPNDPEQSPDGVHWTATVYSLMADVVAGAVGLY